MAAALHAELMEFIALLRSRGALGKPRTAWPMDLLYPLLGMNGGA